MAAGPQNEHDRGRVRAVSRALGLLERLSHSTRPMKLSELAQQQKLAPATCLRLLTTMQERGFVRFDAKIGVRAVGATALLVGANFAATRHIVNAAEPVAGQLSTGRRVTVNLGALDRGSVSFLYRVTPGKPSNSPPERIPAHCCAIGKAVLSALPPVEAHAMLGTHLVRVTQNSVVDRHLLFDDLERAHREGYAVDNEENTRGLRCVAAPIFDEHLRPVAAISIAGPAQQLGPEEVASFGQELIAAAYRIMQGFGGRPPSA
jgi:IclR family transcriptional regulator, acetate operon repressor